MKHCLATILLCSALHAAPDTLWARTFGGSGTDVGYGITETPAGELLGVGLTNSFGAGRLDALLVRFSPDGSVISHSTWGGGADEALHGISPVRSGGHVCAGYTASFGAGRKDGWVLRLAESGDTVWSRTFGSGLEDCCYLALETPDSGFAVSGYCNGPSGWIKGDAWLLRLDRNGDTLWTRRYGGVVYADQAYAVCPVPDSGFMVAATTTSFGAGSDDIWLLRLVESGDTIATRTFGGAGAAPGWMENP